MAKGFDTKIFNFLERKKIATKAEIMSKVGCSGTTIAEALKRGPGYLTSYTHNRRYYAFKSNLEFDKTGSCFYKGIGFREKGTIKNTILDKLYNSEAGMNSSEIENMLGKVGRDVLARLHVKNKVVSQLFDNVRYYFCSEESIRVSQIAERQNLYNEECERENELRQETILYVVGVCLRTSKLSAKKIYQKLKKMGIAISIEEVERVMKIYELENMDKRIKKNFG